MACCTGRSPRVECSINVMDDSDAAAYWWSIASGDLAGARELAAASVVAPRLAASLAQQAAEKALKAVHALRGDEPPRTHDLVALAKSLRAEPEIQMRLEDLRQLTDIVESARYPIPIAIALDWADVNALIALASSVMEAVRSVLSRAGMNTASIDPA